MGKTSVAVRRNESYSWPFAAYQCFILMSTLLSPATVILIIIGGLQYGFLLYGGVVLVGKGNGGGGEATEARRPSYAFVLLV